MVDPQAILQSISDYLIDNKVSKYLVANKDLVRILLTIRSL